MWQYQHAAGVEEYGIHGHTPTLPSPRSLRWHARPVGERSRSAAPDGRPAGESADRTGRRGGVAAGVWTDPPGAADHRCLAARVVSIPPAQRGSLAVLGDVRNDGRAMRATRHHDAGMLVLSLWRSDACVATARLSRDEAARLAEVVIAGIAAELATEPPASATA